MCVCVKFNLKINTYIGINLKRLSLNKSPLRIISTSIFERGMVIIKIS
jgi:hypothetical protein